MLRRILFCFASLFVAFAFVLVGGVAQTQSLDATPGTVVDPEHGLMWVSDGAYPVSSGFSSDVVLSREEALRFIDAMNSGQIENFGFTDWRIPTSAELEQLLGLQGDLSSQGLSNAEALHSWATGLRVSRYRAGCWVARPPVPDVVYTWPVRTAAGVPDGFARVVVLAVNSAFLKDRTFVHSGDVVVNTASLGPTLEKDVELSISKDGSTAAFFSFGRLGNATQGQVVADSLQVKSGANVPSDVTYNELFNNGTISGALVNPIPGGLPYFSMLPEFRSGPPGTDDVTVAAGATHSLAAGDYQNVFIGTGGTLLFEGGIYNLYSLDTEDVVELQFQAQSEVRVADKLRVGKTSYVGPATGFGVTASRIIFFVAGINGTNGGLTQKPAAVEFGDAATIVANIYAPNGRILFKNENVAEGAFLAMDVQVEKDVQITLNSFFNEAPQPADDSYTVDEGQTVAGNVLDNDDDPNADDTLSTSLITPPLYASSFNFTSDGAFSYTHNGTENFSDGFEYEVCDDGNPSLCTAALVSITIIPVNDPPVITGQTPDPLVTDEDTALTVLLEKLVVTDPDNRYPADFTLSVLDGTNYSRSGNTITPAQDYHGLLSVPVKVNDGTDDSNIFNVSVDVLPVNDAPVGVDDPVSVLEGGTTTPGLNVLGNDSDVDGDNLSVKNVGVIRTVNGLITIDPNGQFSYLHNGSETIVDTFAYQVCDDGLPQFCTTASILITIVPVNDPPTANPQDVQLPGGGGDEGGGGSSSSLDIILTGSDPENANLLFTISSGPSNGSLGPVTPIDATSASVTYTSNDSSLSDAFVFELDDQQGGTDTATVNIAAAPGVPIASVVANDKVAEGTLDTPIDIVTTGDAPDGVALSFEVVSGPSSGSLSALTDGSEIPQRSASLTYTPGAGYIGDDSFTFEACGTVNSIQECDQAVVSITVRGTLAADREIQTFNELPLQIDLSGTPLPESSGGGSITAPPDPPRAAVQPGKESFRLGTTQVPVAVAGAVSEYNDDFDFLGDEANNLPGPTPVLASAGVGQSGGPGSNGTVRFHMEWALADIPPLAPNDRVFVKLSTTKGTEDSLDTSFFAGVVIGDGQLTASDYELGSGLTALPGVVLSVPGDPAGTDGTFVFDVTDVLAAEGLDGGRTHLVVQGRVDETLPGPARGLQIRTSADGNILDGLQPQLQIVDPVEYAITSLPQHGTLRNSLGALITAVGVLPDRIVTYTPNPEYLGPDGFSFSATLDPVTETGDITLEVVQGTCEDNEFFCKDGR